MAEIVEIGQTILLDSGNKESSNEIFTEHSEGIKKKLGYSLDHYTTECTNNGDGTLALIFTGFCFNNGKRKVMVIKKAPARFINGNFVTEDKRALPIEEIPGWGENERGEANGIRQTER